MQASLPHIKTPPLKLDKPTAERIDKTRSEVEAVTARMNQLHDRRAVKRALAEAPNAYAGGNLDLAAAILAATAAATVADEVISTLRGGCKNRLRELFLSAKPEIDAADENRIAELKTLAAEREKMERAEAAALGVDADDFPPSPILESLRETHRRAVENYRVDSRRAPTKSDFARLLDAVG